MDLICFYTWTLLQLNQCYHVKIQFNTIKWTLCGLFFCPKMSHSLVHIPKYTIQYTLNNYNKQIQDVPIIPCFSYARLCF
jgi:hypothetical protein